MFRLFFIVCAVTLSLSGCERSVQAIIDSPPDKTTIFQRSKPATINCIANKLMLRGSRFTQAEDGNITRIALAPGGTSSTLAIIEVSDRQILLKRNPGIPGIGKDGLDNILDGCAQ
jgi:hypothetical protein